MGLIFLDGSFSRLSRLEWGLIFLDEPFSSLSRLGWGLIFFDESFSSLSRLGWGLTFRLGFWIRKGSGNLRKGLDKKVKSSQDSDEVWFFWWVIFTSLETRMRSDFLMSHFHVSRDSDEVWHPVFGFLNSTGFRKLKERTWQEGQVFSRLGWGLTSRFRFSEFDRIQET